MNRQKRKDHIKGGRLFLLYEGEQVSPNHTAGPRDLEISMFRAWRPEGEPLPELVEKIPGYERPVNWQQLQAAEDKKPGSMDYSSAGIFVSFK